MATSKCGGRASAASPARCTWPLPSPPSPDWSWAPCWRVTATSATPCKACRPSGCGAPRKNKAAMQAAAPASCTGAKEPGRARAERGQCGRAQSHRHMRRDLGRGQRQPGQPARAWPVLARHLGRIGGTQLGCHHAAPGGLWHPGQRPYLSNGCTVGVGAWQAARRHRGPPARAHLAEPGVCAGVLTQAQCIKKARACGLFCGRSARRTVTANVAVSCPALPWPCRQSR